MNKIPFTKNILLKLASFAIAIILWIIAVNVNDPTVTKTYSLPLELANIKNLQANDFILLNEKKISESRIDVQVQATRNDLKFIKQNSDNLKASINFKDIDSSYQKYIGENFSMPVNIAFSNYLNSSRYQITNVYPSKVDILLDKFVTISQQIYYENDGSPAKNYYIKEINIEPEIIQISGAQSIIETIKPINLNLSTSGASKNISTKSPIKIYDKNDNDVTDSLTLSNNEVKVSIEIDSYKTIAVEKPETTGKVANGYTLKSIDYEPKEIEIIGGKKNNLESIKLPPIDIDQASLSKTITYNLNDLLQDGIQIKKGSTDKILITLNIEKTN